MSSLLHDGMSCSLMDVSDLLISASAAKHPILPPEGAICVFHHSGDLIPLPA